MAVGATGLTIQPASTTDYNGATRTFPGLMLDLTAVIPNYDPSMAVRVWLYNSALNNSANYDNAILALDTGNTNFGYVVKRGHGTAGTGGQSFLEIAATNSSGFVSDSYTPDGTNQVMVLETPGIDEARYTTYRGNYSAGFPAASALVVQKSYAANGTIDTSQLTTSLKAVIGAQRAGSGTSLVASFARIKVEYRLTGPGGGSGSGSGSVNATELSLLGGIASVSAAQGTVRVASRTVDMALFPATAGSLTRHVQLMVDFETTSATATATVSLVDVTDAAAVTGASSTTSSTSTTRFASSDLTVGSSNGNVRSDKIAAYELQVSLAGGSPSDLAIVTNARLRISYS
jgi:hypothetical protein